MAEKTSTQIEQELQTQSADYLKRLEAEGTLPTAIAGAWNAAGGAETANLRTKEGDLLKGYVSAGAQAREKYKEVWDPFARESLAAKQTEMDYAPIADVRSELRMRAEALGVATNAASSMYRAGTEVAKTNIGFTQDAFSRASGREDKAAAAEAARVAEATRQKERAEDMAFQASEAAKSRAASRASSGSTKQDKELDKANADLDDAKKEAWKILDEDSDWGKAFNSLKRRQPNLSSGDIDMILGVPADWVQSGRPGWEWYNNQNKVAGQGRSIG
jgi:hypothetical protein